MLNKKDIKVLVEKLGQTDAEMRETLKGMGFSGLSNKLTLAECAINSDYFWSLKRKRWFPDNANDEVAEEFIDFLKEEEELVQRELAMKGPIDITNEKNEGPFVVVFNLSHAKDAICYAAGKGRTRRDVIISAFRQYKRENCVSDKDMPSDEELLKNYIPVAVFNGKAKNLLF